MLSTKPNQVSRREKNNSIVVTGAMVKFTVWATLLIGTQPLPAIQIHNEKPLELSGFSLSQAYDILDDQPLNVDDPTIIKLLYRIKKTSFASRFKYSRFSHEVTWQDIQNKTEDFRLWVFERRLTLNKIETKRLASADADSEIKGVFICHCQNSAGQPVIVLAQSIPSKLKNATDQTVGIAGFLVARSTLPDKPDADAMPVFVVDRLAWYPDQASENANPSQVALASAGVDVGLLDFVAEMNSRPLGSRDAEAFFQILSRAEKVKSGTSVDRVRFNEIMSKPKSNFGAAARIQGRVKDCQLIRVTDADIQTRLGIEQYYQLVVFPDLKGGEIVVNGENGKRVTYNQFPVTVCATHLPPGTSSDDLSRQSLVVDGFFFRLWQYQSEKTDQAELSGQISPLVIAQQLTPVSSDASLLDTMLFVFVAALIFVIGAMLLFDRFADRKRNKKPSILDELPDQIDVSGIQ